MRVENHLSLWAGAGGKGGIETDLNTFLIIIHLCVSL